MPKVTEQYREAKREEIAAAAMRCFAAKGFQGTSMADIIAESGLSAGAIYGHFPGKHEIVLAAASTVIRRRIDHLRAVRTRDPLLTPGEVVAGTLSGLPAEIQETGLLVQVWGEAMVEPGMRDLLWGMFEELRATYADHFAAWAVVNRGLDEATALDWAMQLQPVAIGLAQGYVVQSALFAGFDRDGYLASMRELLPH